MRYPHVTGRSLLSLRPRAAEPQHTDALGLVTWGGLYTAQVC